MESEWVTCGTFSDNQKLEGRASKGREANVLIVFIFECLRAPQ